MNCPSCKKKMHEYQIPYVKMEEGVYHICENKECVWNTKNRGKGEIKMKYDMTSFLQRLKNKYIQWKWDREERKTKIYDPDNEFITYAYHGGFIHSPFHFTKKIYEFGPVIGNPDFNTIFEKNVKYGIFFPIKKELTK